MSRVRWTGFKPIRRDRLIQEQRHDTYKSTRKLPEPTICPRCHGIYKGGMWRWGTPPDGAHERTCPACLRIQDDYPAGLVSRRGGFLADHGEEILNLARNEESRGKTEHALERIMKIDVEDDAVLITTTDIHLARRIGEAVQHAYAGELDYHYQEAEHRLRVNWSRDDNSAR